MVKRLLLLLCIAAGVGYAQLVHAQVSKPPACNGSLSVTIAGSGTGSPLTFGSASVTTPITCYGGTATVTLVVTGGTAPYSYTFNNVTNNTGVFTGVTAANGYNYSITDANNCGPITGMLNVTQPALVVASGTQVNETCFGQSIGSIDLSVTGGSGSYTYLWSPGGETTQDLSSLAAGTYTVVITESNGCTVTGTTSFTITQPNLVVASGTQVDILCNGAATGSIDLTVVGGSGSYTYLWSPGGETTQDISGLVAGTYTVLITESNGCTVTGTTSFTINQATAIILSALVTSDYNGAQVSCASGQGTSDDGEITASATGGTPGYMFSLNGGAYQGTGTFSGLTAGTYTVTVKDNNNCTTSTQVTITPPPPITAGTCPVVNDLCQINAGSVTVQASGGTGALNVTWTATANLPFTGTPGGSPAGNVSTPVPATYTGLSGNSTYYFTVTDANGCQLLP